MSIERKQVPMLVVTDLKNLDPVRVIFENLEPGRGRMIIVCYDRAWTAFWGAMGGGATVEEFVARVSPDYIAGNMLCGSGLDRTQRGARQHESYLVRIIEAVQDALKAPAV